MSTKNSLPFDFAPISKSRPTYRANVFFAEILRTSVLLSCRKLTDRSRIDFKTYFIASLSGSATVAQPIEGAKGMVIVVYKYFLNVIRHV